MQSRSPRLAALCLVLASCTYMSRAVAASRISILVDHENGPACNSLWTRDADNFSCDSLQTVLLSVANCTKRGNDSCWYNDVEIRIARGCYELTELVVIERNITIRAETPGVQVNFSIDCQVLVMNIDYAEIEGISFEGDKGIITFENVTRVFISNSNFR